MDIVYHRGTDDQLWRVNADGTDQQSIGSTLSTPFVAC